MPYNVCILYILHLHFGDVKPVAACSCFDLALCHRTMIITGRKKVKARSSLCDTVHENHKSSANPNVARRRCLGLSASVFEFIKPRCSSRDIKKRPLATPHQHQKVQPILKSVNKPTLQDWIMNSPSLNVHFSGRVHPACEEEKVIEVIASNLQPIDSLCLEKLKLKVDDDDDDDKQAEEDSSIITRQSGVQTKKKVSFRLPQVGDIFFMDSADGYYYSKKLV